MQRRRESNLFWCKDYVEPASRPGPVADESPIGGGCPWRLLHEVLDQRVLHTGEDRRRSRRAFAAFADAQWNLDDTLIDGNRPAVTYELSGHLNGRLGPYEPKGQSVHLAGVQMLEVKGNHIVTSTDYGDGGALHRQLSTS